jgi:FKBP-type peptidyl-prolyl cis-trans isomerase
VAFTFSQSQLQTRLAILKKILIKMSLAISKWLMVSACFVLACPARSSRQDGTKTGALTTEAVDSATGPATSAVPSVAPAPLDVAAPPDDTKKTASGLAMKVLQAGNGGDRPGDDDCVKVTYKGWSRDGVLRISSPAEADGAWVECVRGMVPGILEALKAMSVGEERRAWIPASLAFSADDDDDRTTPKVDMTFDIALLELMKAPPVPKDLKAPPRSATKTSSGLAFVVLKKGEGTEHPLPASRVTVHFSGWKPDGTLLESTLRAKRATTFRLVEVLPGWREALSLMVVGDKVRAWIPAALGYGNKPVRPGLPAGNLVYEFELLAIEP